MRRARLRAITAVASAAVAIALIALTALLAVGAVPRQDQDAEPVARAGAPANSWDLAAPGQAYSYEFDLMARVISAEAKGEPYIGQVAVGAVILNRVEHPHFPKTIPGVIFEPDAFTAVSTGHIWDSPAQSSIRAAQDALAGWDPTGGALYYYNPAKATNWWVAGRVFLVQIGRHIFLR